MGDFSHTLNRSQERGLVCFRWLRETADFSNELERGSANLVLGDRWLEIEQGSNIPAHNLCSHITA
jgi:hypothetical protein